MVIEWIESRHRRPCMAHTHVHTYIYMIHTPQTLQRRSQSFILRSNDEVANRFGEWFAKRLSSSSCGGGGGYRFVCVGSRVLNRTGVGGCWVDGLSTYINNTCHMPDVDVVLVDVFVRPHYRARLKVEEPHVVGVARHQDILLWF